MTFLKNLATLIWETTAIREGFLFVVTAVVMVVTAQLNDLGTLFNEGADIEALKTWAGGAAAAVILTVVRQSIAFAVSRLAGSTL